MLRIALAVALSLVLVDRASALEPPREEAAKAPEEKPAPHLLDRFKALAGEWSAEGLDGNSDPQMRIRYEVTAGGSAVVETLWPGGPHEMRTVYFRDGEDVVLTHYCASGHHPRMRAKPMEGNKLVFAFDGASNFDPAKDGHMHDAHFVFEGADEIRSRWSFWNEGKPGDHVADMHVKRVR
ncbi:MAG: hypothetical protein IT479_15790 [Xanthomonadales bacterium]|nr:hypothetical protein [Xanthomonadales bacterium]